MSRFATARSTRKTNPWILVAHAQPTFKKSDSSISGKMTPPMEPPVVAIPVALARLARKKCPMAATAGVTIRDVPAPPRMPKTIRNCQYSAPH